MTDRISFSPWLRLNCYSQVPCELWVCRWELSGLADGNRHYSYFCASSGHFPLILLGGPFPGLEQCPGRHAKGESLHLSRLSVSSVLPSGLYPKLFKCLSLTGPPALSPPLLESPGLQLVSRSLSCGWKLGGCMTVQDSCDLEFLCLSAGFSVPWPSCFPISWFTPLLAKIYLSSNSFIRMDVWEVKMFNPFWSENNLGLQLGLTERYLAVQLLSHVWLFGNPWTGACQACLSFTISWSLLKLMSNELVMPSNHLILCRPLLLLPSIFPSIGIFSNDWLFTPSGQSIGASALASALTMNIQGWFPLELTTKIP